MHLDLSNYNEVGVTKVEGVFNQVDLDKINSEVNKLSKLVIDMPVGSHVNFADSDKKIINSIHRLEEIDTSLKDFSTHPSILKISKSILGEDPTLFSIQLFLKPASKGLATPAHQDNAYWQLSEPGGLTIWVALDHVDEKNGAVQFIPGSHLQGNVKHNKSVNTPGSSRVVDDKYLDGKDWISFVLNPGDCTVHGGLSIHRSSINRSGNSRRALLFNFKAKNSLRDEEAFIEYNKDLESIHGRTY